MPDTIAVTTRRVPGADAEVISSFFPVPGLGFIPINCFLLHAREPVLVDTGPVVLRDQYVRALEQLIDLEDVRWIYLTHADPDHVGCVRDVLAAAPNAQIVTTFLGLGRLTLYHGVTPDRVYLLNPGQRLSVGDRELRVIEPLTFDAPDTTAFTDSQTGTLFSSDSFGGIVAGPAECAADLSATALRDGVVTWATIDAPWLRHVNRPTFEAATARFRELDPPVVLSSHLPPAHGLLEVLLDHVATARAQPRWVGPDQAALTALLASLAEPGPRDEEAHPQV
ncbi:MAG: Diflavin flavoprotein [Myxococcales bacterium]|nr:Diflavin flavoprotein [Myxococcales bacterium]